jgi:Na+-translocating ferredoxin:NAD+ oxidoreductase RnfD subunit
MNAPGTILQAEAGSARIVLSPAERRDGGLVRFAIAITVLNILGHLWLGFEQSWATPIVALAACYGTELSCEWTSATSGGRVPRFRGGPKTLVKFLLSAHITGLAVGMLLYAAEQLWVVAFAGSAAVASKYIFRVALPPNGATRHFYNPSNLGIAMTLVLFPNVGIAPPYQFAENITGAIDWLIPLAIITTGSLLNTKFTQRIPLIISWLFAFAAQAFIRAALHGTPVLAGLAPMTGFAFILFTFYMITDPATTPDGSREQSIFAVSVAFAYGTLMELHVVFGLFFALALVSTARGILLYVRAPERFSSQKPIIPKAEFVCAK